MASAIEERKLRSNVQINDAPGCTISDMCVLVEHLVANADVATGLNSIHDTALLTIMWHTFGRAIDTCFARKQQLSRAASSELFLHMARINTSVVQGVSICKAPEQWQQCMLHSFGLLFVCYDEPSEYLFPLVPRFAVSDLPGGQTYTQEEGVLYWESLQNETESGTQPALKRERKRPKYCRLHYRSYQGYPERDAPPALREGATPNMTSHSLRLRVCRVRQRLAKLSIQWISTRGAWLLELLTKAFAHIGTTTSEDRSVCKVLAGYEAPDLPVATPTIGDLQQRLSVAEFGHLVTLRDELFQRVLGSLDPWYNVDQDVVDATFAALLIHMEAVLKSAKNTTTKPAHVRRYLDELDRGITATNALLGCRINTETCCEWGCHLAARWRTVNHAQVSSAATGGDTLLASTLTSILSQLTVISDRLGRVEDDVADLTRTLTAHEAHARMERFAAGPSQLLVTAPSPATASIPAGCVLNWYTNRIRETVKGKKEQNKRADAKAAIKIVQVLYQAPLLMPAQPDRSNIEAYRAWKHALWTLAVVMMDRTANERLHTFDSKKPTTKASSLRKRRCQLRTSHPDAYRSLGAQYLALKANGSFADACTPPSHQ